MKIHLFPHAVLIAALAFSPPAKAATNQQSSSLFSSLTDWLDQAKQSISDYTKSVFANFDQQLKAISKDATGSLGLLDPAKLRSNANQVRTNSPVYSVYQTANEGDRQGARAGAAAILSKAGQDRQVEAYQQTQNSIDAVNQHGKTAQGLDVTQNVLKQSLLQNAQTSQMLGGLRSELNTLTQGQAQQSVLLSNVSESLDGQRSAKAYEGVGAGISTLRAGSQARLY